jgi:hypothetical protein
MQNAVRADADDSVADNAQQTSSGSMDGIGPAERLNFGETRTPGEALHPDDAKNSQGVLDMIPAEQRTDSEKPHAHFWNLQSHHSWVLGGIRFGKPFALASKRTERNLNRPEMMNDSARSEALTVTGLELAIILGSGAYELCSSSFGEVYSFEGAPAEGKYDLPECLDHIKKTYANPKWREALSWRSDEPVENGHVVITRLERRMSDGSWESAKDRGSLSLSDVQARKSVIEATSDEDERVRLRRRFYAAVLDAQLEDRAMVSNPAYEGLFDKSIDSIEEMSRGVPGSDVSGADSGEEE